MTTPWRFIEPGLAVQGQLQPQAIASVAQAGFCCLINNRPDGEAADQPDSATLARAARQAGLDYHYLPVFPGQFERRQVQRFGDIVASAAGPVLAFCRSGNRSSCMWALSQLDKRPVDEIIAHGRRCGLDLTAIRPLMLQWKN